MNYLQRSMTAIVLLAAFLPISAQSAGNDLQRPSSRSLAELKSHSVGEHDFPNSISLTKRSS